MAEIKIVERVKHPTIALDTLRRGAELEAPNIQRISFNGTIQKMKYTSKKKFTCNQVDDQYFIVKRIQ